MEIRDTREKMNIPPAGIELNEELIIVSKLSEGGSSYTYRAKKKDSEYVILKEYYPLDRAIYIRDKDGFLKYKDSLDESQRAEESRFRDAWMSGELEIANIAFREEKSNSDCSFGHHLVKLESEKTDSAFIEIGTVNGEPLDEWCKVIWARAAGEKEKRKELIEMLQKICSVVESFHKKGIIHCDLKPQNIYITEHKSVFILDFATSIYREKNEIKACGPELGGISEGYSSMSIRDLSTSLDNITRINEADDIYSIIQILFYMLFGKTVEQITDDCSDKNFDELVEELVGSHLEAQHLLLICMLLDDKKRLNMSNIQRCLEDLQHTEAMLADEKTHFLSELVKPGTFHNLRSLLVLIGKITCAVKDSRPYGKRFLLDIRDILVKGSLESDYTVAVASIKAIPGLDGTASDEKENVRKIRLLLRGFIKNSEDSGEPICDGINCVGRRKLEKLLDDECFLNYNEFNNAIEELKNYSDPELTYFETNAEEQSIQQRFVLEKGDWDCVIRYDYFHTNNYAAFINELIERLKKDENSIICVLKYDDDICKMIERIPMTIPYGNDGRKLYLYDDLKIENNDNLYVVIWGISESYDEIRFKKSVDEIRNELNALKLSNAVKERIKYIYVDSDCSSGERSFTYQQSTEKIDIYNNGSYLGYINKQNRYGISYNSIEQNDIYEINNLLEKEYAMQICGQIYISVKGFLTLRNGYTKDRSFEPIKKIFKNIVGKSTYNYNDELTMLGILSQFENEISPLEMEKEALLKNVRYEFLYNDKIDYYKKAIQNGYQSILGRLYLNLKNDFNWDSQEKFFEFLSFSQEVISDKIINRVRVNFLRGDYFHDVEAYIEQDKLYENIKNVIKNCLHEEAEECLRSINEKLINILMTPNKYFEIEEGRCIEKEYDETDIKKLKSYYVLKETDFDLAYNIYLLVYLAFYKKLPEGFWAGINYEISLKEFNDEVVAKYGGISRPAVREILFLADEKKNIFALYEKADLYYYGSRGNVEQDLSKAYDTYMIAANLKVPTPDAEPEHRDKSFSHPLALWSLSYMLLNYHKDGKRELANCPPIAEIEKLKPIERIERAIMYAQKSSDFLSKSGGDSPHGPSENILGQIARLSEDDCSGIEELKKKYNMDEPKKYFDRAAAGGYIYAINNLILMEKDKIFLDSAHTLEHLSEYIRMLKEQVKKYETWSCNTLGEFYRTGEVKREIIVDGEKITEKKVFVEKIDRTLAYGYYKKAVENFIDGSSSWAYCNMLIYYPNKIKEENLLESYVKAVQMIGTQEQTQKHIELLKSKLKNLYGKTYEEIIGEDAHES